MSKYDRSKIINLLPWSLSVANEGIWKRNSEDIHILLRPVFYETEIAFVLTRYYLLSCVSKATFRNDVLIQFCVNLTSIYSDRFPACIGQIQFNRLRTIFNYEAGINSKHALSESWNFLTVYFWNIEKLVTRVCSLRLSNDIIGQRA